MKEQKENRMAVEPVGKLMLSMGIPMVLSMMLQAVYNIVDSAFVGGMKEGGEQALNALTLVSLALAAVFHLKKNTELSNGLRYLKPDMAGMADISDRGGNQLSDLRVVHEDNPGAEARGRADRGGLPLTNPRGGNIIISVRMNSETYLTGGVYDRRKDMEGNYKICHSIVFGKFISAVL